MLKNKQVVFHIKRRAMSNVYMSPEEVMDVMDNLSSLEGKLYTLLKHSVVVNPSIEYFESINLAHKLNCSVGTLNNAKAALKKKGYALITKFKDENGRPMVRVVVGRDQVDLYNLGLMVEITDSKQYAEALKRFPILDPALTIQQREELVKQCNEYYRNQDVHK